MNIVVGLIVLIAGIGGGLLLLNIALFTMRKRVDSIPDHWLISGSRAPFIWALLVGIGFWGIYLIFGMNLKALEVIYVFAMVFTLSVVDGAIRKIPNGILLALIVGAVGFMIWGDSTLNLWERLFGLLIGTGIFLAPFIFGKQAGGGDVKYAAVIGFSLGFYYTIMAFVIMSMAYLGYVCLLLISKKGDLKTKTALGPYMSFGFLLALIMMKVV
jgi:leader peptidase (prepilin peptidase)/N-methyltransferase